MSDSAGARIAMGLGIVALVVVLAFILEQVAGTEQAVPDATPSQSAPGELQFCASWGTLSAAAGTDRVAEEADGPSDIREALVQMQELGLPTDMPADARAGFLAAMDRIEGDLDPEFAPTAYPAEPDERAAFTSYLEANCPA